MGKKTKVDINSAPLEAVTIGQIKKSKYGWIGTIIIFVLFISVVYFLPELSKYYQQITQGNTTNNKAPINNVTNEVIEEEPEEQIPVVDDSLYSFENDFEVSLADLSFSNVTLNNNLLSFAVKNTSNQTISLEDKKLYFITFDSNTEEKNTLNTIELSASILSGQEITLSYNVKPNASYYDIKSITEDDYTYIVLETDENNIATLTCDKDEEKIIYSFIDDKLVMIEQNASVAKTSDKYDSLYDKYHTIVIKYGNISGINATLSTNVDSMQFALKIDYNNYNSEIEGSYYFPKDTSSRIVNFKMESKLFECK